MIEVNVDKNFAAYHICSNKEKIQFDTVHHFLDKESYWAKGIPTDTLRAAIANSICLGAYLHDGTQIAFGRMITDCATFGYLADIFVVQAHRRKGISKELMAAFCELGEQFGLRRFLLTTQDAHGLYQQFQFVPFPYPERLMSRAGVVYQQKK